MTADTHDNTARKHALEVASDWLVRLEDPEISNEQVEAWHAWVDASPLNARAFEDVSRVWDLAPAVSSDAILAARQDRAEPGHRPSAARQTMHVARFRDAAAPAPRRRRRWLGWSGLCAGLAVLAFVVYASLAGLLGHSPEQTGHYATTTAQHRNITLPDGTTVELGAASELQIEFTPGLRLVSLVHGQAYFDVATDARPFEVRAGRLLIRDIGTRFDVGLRAEGVRVTVAQGRVRLRNLASGASRSGQVLELGAGYQASLRPGHGLSTPRKVNVQRTLAWRRDVMVYLGEPLGHVVADMNRYATIPVVLGNASLKTLPVTGRWDATDVSGWLGSLASALSLQVACTPDRVVLTVEAGTAASRDGAAGGSPSSCLEPHTGF